MPEWWRQPSVGRPSGGRKEAFAGAAVVEALRKIGRQFRPFNRIADSNRPVFEAPAIVPIAPRLTAISEAQGYKPTIFRSGFNWLPIERNHYAALPEKACGFKGFSV